MKATKENMPRRASLFWDVDPKTVDPDTHATYVIERILDFGHDAELEWLTHYYPENVIYNVVKKSRVLHDKSRSLWTLVFRPAR